jgi:ribosomal protein S18 acetylase RimI-like enzyme
LNPSLIIQKSNSKDSSTITSLAQITFRESHGHSASKAEIDHYVNLNLNKEAIKKELLDPTNDYYLIYHDEKAVGFLKILLNTTYKGINQNKVTKLERIYVLQSHHGLKLGLALIDHAIDVAKDQDQRGMWLYTWIENLRAVAFYEKKGFKIIDSADFKISDTHSNPNHIMYLKFD